MHLFKIHVEGVLVPTLEAGADDEGFQAERFQKTCKFPRVRLPFDAQNTALAVTEITALLVTVYTKPASTTSNAPSAKPDGDFIENKDITSPLYQHNS